MRATPGSVARRSAWRRPPTRTAVAGAVVAVVAGTAALVAAVAATGPWPGSPAAAHPSGGAPAGIDTIVVIYQENHSFDNLFGGWEQVDGLAAAAGSGRVRQVAADGHALPCLPQTDVNLAALPATCHGSAGGVVVDSAFANQPFAIGDHLRPADRTCPPPGEQATAGTPRDAPGALPGGCTRDLVHRFYQEQYQIHGGRMDRYVTGSDAAGLAMGTYDTRSLPLYRYLHTPGAPRYLIADRFFQAAFGGSFLNHQWLVAAATPTWPGAVADGGTDDLHSLLGPDGMPAATLLHAAPGYVRDTALTQAADATGRCLVPAGVAAPPRGTACGDFAVNTVQPAYQPAAPDTAPGQRLPPQTAPTIGDRLSAHGIGWAWYAGGWDDADGHVGAAGWTNGGTPGVCASPRTVAGAVYPNCLDATFQVHHQPFNYFARYAPGTAARAAHLRDEVEFLAAARTGRLPAVSFVKPLGQENEHPGYASEHTGSDHLVDLLTTVLAGPQAARTMVIVTYDEFGGQWDHVSPPVADRWGPGTRIPALVISPALARPFAVDHTTHDTTAILATIEHRFGLRPLTTRDARAADLWGGFGRYHR